jgi:hypothetical protein
VPFLTSFSFLFSCLRLGTKLLLSLSTSVVAIAIILSRIALGGVYNDVTYVSVMYESMMRNSENNDIILINVNICDNMIM